MLTARSFAGAPSQGVPQPQRHEREFTDVADRLRGTALEVCRHLLPGGQVRGREFVAGDLRGGRGDSLSVNLDSGVWSDFATGEGGADLINLWAAARRLPNFQAKREAEAWLGLEQGGEPVVVARSPKPQPAGSTPATSARSPDAEAGSAPIVDGQGPGVLLSAGQDAPVSADPPDEGDAFWYRRVKHETRWDYRDATGEVVAMVYRFRHPETGAKVVRPWDPKAQDWKAIEGPRPILYLDEIARRQTDPVVIVEGEKCADAVRELGWLGTSAMMGAQSTGKTDWSPLRGRNVILWRDNDEGGQKWLADMQDHLRGAGAASVRIVEVPEGKKVKWDVADSLEEDDPSGKEARTLLVEAIKSRPVVTARAALDIRDWSPDRFAGTAPERRWLVNEVFPLGVAAILAAMGDTGKGITTLNLALQVAGGRPDPVFGPLAFGCTISAFGAAVILAAEDDHDEIHRRMAALDRSGKLREAAKGRLMVVPLPNAGGAMPLFVSTSRGIELTEAWGRLRDQLLAIDDLKLVVLDPLASFVQADLNKDQAAASYIMGMFAALAGETGATVLATHHMRKPGGRDETINSPEQARAAVRGQSALVDGSRVTYAMWTPRDDDAKAILKQMGEPVKGDAWRNRVVKGAVVKSNGPADRTIRTYIRDETGLLVDTTKAEKDMRRAADEDALALLERAIADAAEAGQPYTKSGATGLHELRHRLPEDLKGMSARDLGGKGDGGLLRALLDQGRAIYCLASGTSTKWLDVPSGPFAKGLGEFSKGGWSPLPDAKRDERATFRSDGS